MIGLFFFTVLLLEKPDVEVAEIQPRWAKIEANIHPQLFCYSQQGIPMETLLVYSSQWDPTHTMVR